MKASNKYARMDCFKHARRCAEKRCRKRVKYNEKGPTGMRCEKCDQVFKNRIQEFIKAYEDPEEQEEDQSMNLSETCSVCQSFMKGSEAKQMVCGHSMHAKCLQRWLKQSPKCPVCRGPAQVLDQFVVDMKEGDLVNGPDGVLRMKVGGYLVEFDSSEPSEQSSDSSESET